MLDIFLVIGRWAIMTAVAEDRAARTFSDMADVYVDLTGLAAPLLSLAGPVDGARVLDVGCGPGTAGVLARDAGASSVIGVDRAPAMLARARMHTTVVHADACALPFPAASFDVVLANSVLQFTGPASLPEWQRVGGRVACSIPHGPTSIVELMAEFVDRTSEPYRSEAKTQLARGRRRPDAQRVRERMGFSSVCVDAVPIVRRHVDAADAFAHEWRHGARIFLEALPADVLPEYEAAFAERVTLPDGSAEIVYEYLLWCFEP